MRVMVCMAAWNAARGTQVGLEDRLRSTRLTVISLTPEASETSRSVKARRGSVDVGCVKPCPFVSGMVSLNLLLVQAAISRYVTANGTR